MPEISRFLGIVIAMYYNDHGPPHFHAKYGEYTGAFSIVSLELIEGKLPRRITSLVSEWGFEHQDELMQNWKLTRERKSLNKISPLV